MSLETATPQPVHADFDARRARLDFPALAQTMRGQRLVYLDSAATTQKPQAVLDAVTELYRSSYGSVHRGVHLLSQRATDAYERAREVVRRFIGAERTEEVVFVRGTTEAVNLVASSFLRPRLGAGDEVLISALEHHSNIVPWQLVCEEKGARLVVVPMDDRGQLLLGEYERLLGKRTRLVALNHVSNAIGTVNPVVGMVALARERGVPVLIDGAQAVPHLPVDVRALDCDFYAFSGHKVYGPSGIGVLWARHELLAEMPPYQGGGDMIASVSFEHTEFATPPRRFEAGTPNLEGAVGLAAALGYLERLGRNQVAAHERRLLEGAVAAVAALPGVRLVGTAEERVGVLSFVVDGLHPHDIGTLLDQQGVAIRAGHHCAQPVMERFGLPGTVRASFALYNTDDDVAALVEALARVREVFG